jgi:hypothetical protein
MSEIKLNLLDSHYHQLSDDSMFLRSIEEYQALCEVKERAASARPTLLGLSLTGVSCPSCAST